MTIWAQDEHRLGPLPVSRRIWVPRGQRPVCRVRRRFAWLSVSGFVRPATGQTWWGLLPTVSAKALGLAFGPDGSLYLADLAVFSTPNMGAVRRVVPPGGAGAAGTPATIPASSLAHGDPLQGRQPA